MRLVLDTSVLVSALIFRSSSLSWIRESWQSGMFRPLLSDETKSELIRVLFYAKFNLTDEGRQSLLDDYLPWCETVLVRGNLPVPECRDDNDLPFLKLALAGKADALVTRDPDLLVLADEFTIPIVTASELKSSLEG